MRRTGKAATQLDLRRAVALALSVVAAFFGLASTAAAEGSHPFISAFGSSGTSTSKFQEPTHLAVDQQTHDVYVVDRHLGSKGSLYRFTSSGAPDNFTAGPAAGTNRIGNLEHVKQVAVAPAGAPGGTAGDVYLVDEGDVRVYSPQGELLGTIDGSGNPLTDHSLVETTPNNLLVADEPWGVAVDTAGNLYIAYGFSVDGGEANVRSTSIDKYVPSSQPLANGDFDSQITGAGAGPLGASAVSLYVGSERSGASKFPLSLFPGSGGTADASASGTKVSPIGGGVSIDPSNEDVYFASVVGSGDPARQFDKDGTLLATIDTPNSATGVAVDATSGRVFVSNDEAGNNPEDQVRIYGPLEVVEPPTAEIDPVSNLKFSSAHFSGTVNSGGTGEGQATTYRFKCTPACPGLQGDRSIPTDGADHEVSDDTSGLTPGTSYEVTLIAKNKGGEAKDTLSFETPVKPSATPPAVTIDAVTSFDSDSAHLTGTVDPMGSGENQATTYRFEYTSDGVKWIALEDQGPIEGSGAQVVSTELEGLGPNTTYSVRLSAENLGGEVTSSGPNPSFTTEAIAPAVEVTAATQVLPNSARINGRVNPRNSQTTYYFQWGTADCASNPCASVPASKDADAGSGNSFEFVGAEIAGLSPSTTYSYRLVAKSTVGEVASASQSFTTAATSSPCSNAGLQVGPSTNLPDCRAYEMVSPLDKGGTDVSTNPLRTRTTPDGNAVTYSSTAAFAGATSLPASGGEYRSVRGPEGWTTRPITPVQPTPPAVSGLSGSAYVGEFSPDLETGVFRALSPIPGATPPNVTGATNLFLATGLGSANPSFQPLSDSVTPLGEEIYESIPHIQFADASADFGHVLFEDTDNLTADASGGLQKLYEWDEGTVSLAGILPDSACGSPPCPAAESVAGTAAMTALDAIHTPGSYTQLQHVISDDGSRVFFSGGITDHGQYGFWGSLYLREDGTHTVQIDASERSTPDPKGPGRSQFQIATPDGKHAYFLSKEELVDADKDGTGISIYRYDTEAPEGERLTLIPTGSIVPERVINMSDDGAYVYWVGADGKFSAIFMLHGGEFRKVVTRLAVGAPGYGNEPNLGEKGSNNDYSQYNQARIARGGRTLLFASKANLTGYDPHLPGGKACDIGSISGTPCSELYLFNADSGKVSCVSCSPFGEPPADNASFTSLKLPGVGDFAFVYLNSPMTRDGRYVFFDSPDALVERDSNGKRDAYAYDVEAEQLHLISTGQCNCESYFLEATPSGHDVFFTTRQQLVRSDSDDLMDVYDARTGGGIAAQNAAPPAECQGDACQAPPTAPPSQTPSSQGFSGPGNQPAAHKAKKAKKHKKRRAHKKRAAHKRAAKSNRGGQK